MTNKQREMFWLVGENNNGKNIVIVKTNTGKACFYSVALLKYLAHILVQDYGTYLLKMLSIW